MSKGTPDYQDADLVLRVYEMRREPVIRASRDAFNGKFWPASYEEVKEVATIGHELNAAYRQLGTYWEMVYGLVRHGIVHPEYFMETNGEGLFLYAKVEPYLEQLRKDYNPTHPAQHRMGGQGDGARPPAGRYVQGPGQEGPRVQEVRKGRATTRSHIPDLRGDRRARRFTPGTSGACSRPRRRGRSPSTGSWWSTVIPAAPAAGLVGDRVRLEVAWLEGLARRPNLVELAARQTISCPTTGRPTSCWTGW